MNRKIFVIFFCVFSNLLLFAQNDNNYSNITNSNVIKLLDSARLYISNTPSKSINFAEEAYSLSQNNNYYLGKTLSLKMLAAAYRNLDNYSKALEYLFVALKIDNKEKSDVNLANTYNDIGLIYYRINNYEKALESYLLGLKNAEFSGNSKILSNLYNNIGAAYQVIGKFDDAELYLQKALRIFEENKDSTGIARLFNNLGYLSETAGNNQNALKYYENSLKIKLKLNNKLDIANTMQNLASIYLSLQNSDKAINLLQNSIELANSINNKKLKADAYLLLTFCYFYKRDAKQSLNYRNLFFKTSEEIKRDDQARKIAELLVKNKLEQKEKDNLYLARLTNVQRYYMIIIGVIFTIVVITLIILIRNKNSINKKLTESSIQLKKRIEFIEFLSNSSSNLINVPLNEIDNNIIHFLQFLTDFNDRKFVALFTYSQQNNSLTLKYKFVNPDFIFDAKEIVFDNRKNEALPTLFFDKPITYSVSDNTIPGLSSDYVDPEIRTILFIPIKIENKLWGVIISGTTLENDFHNEELINIFSLSGEVLSNALKRKMNEERLVFYSKELEEINRSKDRFYSMISHDLKSPFQGLLGLASFIISEADNLSKDEIKEFVGNIENSAKNLFGLLENLLNWTRFELGRIQYYPEKFYLYDLLEEIENLLMGSAKKKEINLNFEIDKDFTLVADRKMLYSILSNLIINGIKFTKPKGMVTVSAQKSLSNIIIKVSDNGIGMTNNQINNLFDITNINSTPGTNNEKGTGLGLLLVGEMIEKLKGKIEVTSAIGKGTCFIISLPQ
ncbi:MAG TPA: tetratricopeptide repeat protein [Melioribacteraceae bacterium]|nr:tetratricopeptide repeat protein [Melioribacteraceae bacterium]